MKERALPNPDIPKIDDWLESLILYLLYHAPYRQSAVKLQKLLYLCDLLHYTKYGHPLTRVPFKSYFYGPYSDIIEEKVRELEEKEILKYKEVITPKGYTARVPTPLSKRVFLKKLPEEAKETMKEVVRRWGDKPPSEITAYVKSTLPYLLAKFGETIDFTVIQTEAPHIREFEPAWQVSEISPPKKKKCKTSKPRGVDPLFHITAPLRSSANRLVLSPKTSASWR